ncbi:hypothetical protein REPUB_Repub11eG0102700 [Reevesia pubescens]
MVCSKSALFPLSSLATEKKYLQEAWPKVKSALKEYGIVAELNLAIKILDDEMQCDIVKIGNLVRNKERFVKRRQRLVGPNSSTLKALEILTGCYMLVREALSLLWVHLKILMMKKELEKDPALKDEIWDRFLPKFKKLKSKEKKPHTPFPPPQLPSKMDQELESGEYFLCEKKKLAKNWQEKQEKQAQKTADDKRKREATFVPPQQDSNKSENNKEDFAALAMSLKQKAKEFGKQKSFQNINAEEYIAALVGEQPSKWKKEIQAYLV